jgi:hypothetical protein
MRPARGAVVVLVLAVGALTGCAVLSDGPERPPSTAEPTVHGLDVRTDLDQELASYFEGALTEVTITEVGGDQPIDPVPPTAAPWTRSWTDLPAGRYVVRAAMRPCAGDCGNLDPPTDTCRQRVTLQENTVVRVEFEPGRPCTLRARADDRLEGGQ